MVDMKDRFVVQISGVDLKNQNGKTISSANKKLGAEFFLILFFRRGIRV
jgi:hypothetical protein